MLAVVNLIESAAVTVVGILFLTLAGERLEHRPIVRYVAIGVIFGLVGAVTMLSPVEIAPGFRIDARNVVVALSAAVGGPASLLTAAFVSATRAYFGGGGALVGIVSIWFVAIFSTMLWVWMRRRNSGRVSSAFIVGFAVISALVPLISVHLFIHTPDPNLVNDITRFILPTNFIGTLLLGSLLVTDDQRRWALTAQKETQAQLAAIANNAPGVLFQLRRTRKGNTRFRYVSGGAQRILGVSAQDLIDKPQMISRLVSPEAMEEIQQRLEESGRDQRAWSMVAEFRRPDGKTLWMLVSAEPRHDGEGRQVWDGSLFDITERVESERMKNEFISTVSHELRTPLTSIRGSLGLVTAGVAGELPKKAADLLKIAQSNSERLVRLINDILDIEKIESGRMPFDPSPQELRPLVEQAIEASRGYLVERAVEIELKNDALGAIVSVDPDRLSQVMLNLLSNAIKYSNEGGRVEVGIARRDESLRISVRDHGPGIPASFRDRIFGKFEQADTSDTRVKGGTGLGLSIVKAIVTRLGGSVGFDTEIGEGTTFYVDLPQVVREKSSPDPVKGEGPRILICEDDLEIGRVIEAALEADGFICDRATDIASAKAILARNDYTAMTLDIKLSGESGIALMRDLRTTERGLNLPVIIISAYIDEARKTLNGSAIGIVDWLEKPIDMNRLKSVISNVRRGTYRRRPSVLHVEDDEDVLRIISTGLGDEIAVTPARSTQEARRKLAAGHFDAIILDLNLPDGWGGDLLDDVPPDAAVIIFSAFDVEQELASRVQAALTKTRSSEIAITELIRKLAVGKGEAMPNAQGHDREGG